MSALPGRSQPMRAAAEAAAGAPRSASARAVPAARPGSAVGAAPPPRQGRGGRFSLARLSLGQQMVLLAVLPATLAMMGAMGVLMRQYLDGMTELVRANAQTVGLQLATAAQAPLAQLDRRALLRLAHSGIAQPHVQQVQVWSDDGEILANAETQDRARGAGLRAVVPVPAPDGRSPVGQVMVEMSLDAVASARRAVWLNVLLALAASLAGVALAAGWAARRISAPIRRLARAVDRLGAGEEAHVVIEGAAEVRRLQHGFNATAHALAEGRRLLQSRIETATAELARKNAQLEVASQAKTRLLAAASHDLRQPLHAMGLFIDGLLTGAADAQRPALLRLQESTAFMSLLLDDLLEISRLDARVLTPEVVDLPLAPLFDALAAQHAAHAAASRVRLVWRARGLAVRSDGGMLQRVIGNLVANAIRHSPPGGTVLVAARRRGGDRVRIEVRDRGVGIAPIHQQRIFEEFYQVANVERDRRQGFGLGLAICARLAMLLGSRIGLNSALGCGSTFSLALPQAQAAPRAAPLPAASVLPAEPSLAGLRCLMVDDDAHIRIATAELLAQWGCEAVCLASARDAVACLGAPGERFDLVLCDLQLAEGEDGLDVLAAARRLQPDALAVVISGATGPQALQRLRAAGATVLTKPVAPARLRALLATLK